MRKILITGATGKIGNGLLRNLGCLFSPVKNTISLLEHRTSLGLPRDSPLETVTSLEEEYDLAIHLAAKADTRYCSRTENRKKVWSANVGLTQKICNSTERVILISTDYVFHGDLEPGEVYSEGDPVNPIDFYGETKVAAEEIVRSVGGDIVRIGQMLGVRNSVVDTARRAITGKDKDYFPFLRDNVKLPSDFSDFLAVLKKIIERKDPSIYHVSCEGEPLSRNEIAEMTLEIYKERGWKRSVDSLRSEESGNPKRFVLGNRKTQRELGVEFADARIAVRNHVLEGL